MAEERTHVDNARIIDILENLIETCRDGQNGFRDAAEHVKDHELREFFNARSLERAQFAGELENEAIRHGKHDVDRSGSATAGLHRRWIDLKAALGGGDGSILSAAETGEDNAKKQFDEALEANLPQDLRSIIVRQAESVRASHDQVKALRDRKKAA